jgi:hypothetical protein
MPTMLKPYDAPTAPPAKDLEESFPGKGKELRGLMKGTVDAEQYSSVMDWVRQCLHEPPLIEKVLEAVNEVMEGFGTESIRGSGWDRYWTDTAFVYINLGDTYTRTICYRPEMDRFYLCSWGDMVESLEKRGERFE